MPTKPKISNTEANEIMALYFKLTGRKITEEPNPREKLLNMHKLLTDYLKSKNKPL